MRKVTLIALLGLSILPSSSIKYSPNVIYEEFIDKNLDGYIEIYVVSTPKFPEKTRVLISREFADEVCKASNQKEETIRINYNSRFTSNIGLVKPKIMDMRTQRVANERNKIAVLNNGVIINY